MAFSATCGALAVRLPVNATGIQCHGTILESSSTSPAFSPQDSSSCSSLCPQSVTNTSSTIAWLASYLIILLVLISIAGALMITDHSFGGHIATQTGVGLLAIASTFGIINAYYNIKRLQIDQHRAWMLRVWFWMASIITLRIILVLSAVIISMYPSGWYQVMPCAELLYIANSTHMPLEKVYSTYPVCSPGNSNLTVDSQDIVKASFNGNPGQIGAALI
ncbi:hypothetical protein N7465_001676 [Penicillium sp. CMV-2018d]|nr:hypothetical protein N7465_001676 [Penicillium sp. CMV-2018d]